MAVGNQRPETIASDWAARKFEIEQRINKVNTMTLCRVVSCTNNGGIEPTGKLVVQPLVNMMSGDRIAFQHKELYEVPYCRVIGGKNAVILDPEPGDLGLCGFCMRDISAVKASKDISNPGSDRKYSMADGVYICGWYNADTPEQYIVFTSAGLKMVSPTLIELQAPTINLKGDVNQSDGDVHSTGTITADVDVIADDISGKHHKHISAAPGNPTGEPLP